MADQYEELRRENERLIASLKKANDQAEHFERQWYLRGDELAALREDARRYRWLRERFMAANFAPEEMDLGPGVALIFVAENGLRVSASLDMTIDAALHPSKGADSGEVGK